MNNRQAAVEFLTELCSCTPKSFFNMIDTMQRGLDFLLLCVNEADGEVSSGSLARKLGVSTARIAALLKKLEGKGLIERCSSPKDARRTIVKITPSGTSYIEDKKEQMLTKVELLLEKVGSEDMESFIRICKEISKVLEEYSKKDSKNDRNPKIRR